MKKTLFGLFAVAMLAGSAAFAAEKTDTIKVSGWHCGGCAARTEAALKEVKGVTAVKADKNAKQVTVTYDDAKVKPADLEKAIADAGYSVEKGK